MDWRMTMGKNSLLSRAGDPGLARHALEWQSQIEVAMREGVDCLEMTTSDVDCLVSSGPGLEW